MVKFGLLVCPLCMSEVLMVIVGILLAVHLTFVRYQGESRCFVATDVT